MNRRLPLVFCSLLIAVAVIGAPAYSRYPPPIAATPGPTTLAAATTTAPATTQVVKRKIERGPTTQLLDIVRLDDPKYPTTQRLDTPLDLRYAARIVLSAPVYLDTQGNLWLTRPDAPATFNFLKAASSETATHLVRDEVVFVLWTQTDNGLWIPHLIVRNQSVGGDEGYELVDYDGRRPLPDPYGFKW